MSSAGELPRVGSSTTWCPWRRTVHRPQGHSSLAKLTLGIEARQISWYGCYVCLVSSSSFLHFAFPRISLGMTVFISSSPHPASSIFPSASFTPPHPCHLVNEWSDLMHMISHFSADRRLTFSECSMLRGAKLSLGADRRKPFSILSRRPGRSPQLASRKLKFTLPHGAGGEKPCYILWTACTVAPKFQLGSYVITAT